MPLESIKSTKARVVISASCGRTDKPHKKFDWIEYDARVNPAKPIHFCWSISSLFIGRRISNRDVKFSAEFSSLRTKLLELSLIWLIGPSEAYITYQLQLVTRGPAIAEKPLVSGTLHSRSIKWLLYAVGLMRRFENTSDFLFSKIASVFEWLVEISLLSYTL